MSKRDWRYYRERQRRRGKQRRERPRNAGAAIERLLEDQLDFRGFPAALEAEAGRAADAAERSPGRRRDLTEQIGRAHV